MILSGLASVFVLVAAVVQAAPTSIEDTIRARAAKDGIDLSVLECTPAALTSIADTYRQSNIDYDQINNKQGDWDKPNVRRGVGNIFDVHAHAEPDWYRAIVPYTGNDDSTATGGGSLVPQWNISSHMDFMDKIGISHTVLGFTGPSANAYMGDRQRTAALARLINEQLSAYARAYSDKFSFFASIPLPYVEESMAELEYAQGLGSVGVALLTNHEGKYLGHEDFKPFWSKMDGMGGRQIVYVHPSTPYMNVNDTYLIANPYPGIETSRMEFYMETARTFMDLSLSQTLQNFQNIHYILPHLGGAFPIMIDRVLKTEHTDLYDSSVAIYRSRFWWDSAGPTYLHQASGLLAYDIPKGNLLYGTDYPFVHTESNQADLQSIMDYPGLSDSEKEDLFSNNYKSLFGDKLNF